MGEGDRLQLERFGSILPDFHLIKILEHYIERYFQRFDGMHCIKLLYNRDDFKYIFTVYS